MGTKAQKHTRAAKRRVSKTTDSRQQLAERDEAARILIENRMLKARKLFFCLYINHTLVPVAGTERPLRCPWCGKDDEVRIVITHEHCRAHAECGVCGGEAPSTFTEDGTAVDLYEVLLQAARNWNRRGHI